MQFNVNHRAVQWHNSNIPEIASSEFELGNRHTVRVEVYFDYYGTMNARFFVNNALRNTQWNGGGYTYRDNDEEVALEWYLPSSFVYPTGIAQYKFRREIATRARKMVDRDRELGRARVLIIATYRDTARRDWDQVDAIHMNPHSSAVEQKARMWKLSKESLLP